MAPTPFETLVAGTIGLIPEVADGMRRNISDMNLLRAAAEAALSRYVYQDLLMAFVAVIAQHDMEVETELAAFLMSLYTLDDDTSPADVLLHRFQSADVPDWLTAYSLKSYATTIVAEVVARHLIDAGGWERPAHLAPSRRGVPRPASARTPALDAGTGG